MSKEVVVDLLCWSRLVLTSRFLITFILKVSGDKMTVTFILTIFNRSFERNCENFTEVLEVHEMYITVLSGTVIAP